MVEMVWTTMHIGGALRRDLVDELVERLEEDFHECSSTDDWSEDGFEAVAKDTRSFLVQGQCNYGDPDAVKAFCVDNDLTYWCHNNSQSGCFSSAIEIWTPEFPKALECSADPENYIPVRDIHELEAALKAGQTLEQVVGALRVYTSEAVPPLTLVDGIPTEAEMAAATIGA